MPEIKNTVNRIKGKLDITEEKINKLEDIPIETPKQIQIILEFIAFLWEINFACL